MKQGLFNSLEEKGMFSIKRRNAKQRRNEALQEIFHKIIEKPIRFICKMTIPLSEVEKWHRGFASFNPIGSLFVILLATSWLDIYSTT